MPPLVSAPSAYMRPFTTPGGGAFGIGICSPNGSFALARIARQAGEGSVVVDRDGTEGALRGRVTVTTRAPLHALSNASCLGSSAIERRTAPNNGISYPYSSVPCLFVIG